LPLRLPVQAVYKFDDRRIVAGRIESGRIAVGDEIAVTPSGRRAVVRTIESWPDNRDAAPRAAGAGQSVGITLDRELFISRGDVIVPAQCQAASGRWLKARIFWLHETPLETRAFVTVRIGTAETRGTIMAIANAFDPGDQSLSKPDAIGQNHVGEVEIALSSPIVAELYEANPRLGRVVLDFGGRIAGGGLVLALDGQAESVRAAAEKSKALTARAADLDRALAGSGVTGRLAAFRDAVDGPIVFTTSFWLEDQVILHHICEAGLDIYVVTLDTGRLFAETYATWEATEQRYGRRIRVIYPQHAALEALVAAQGVNGFYQTKDARIACCGARKVEPLKRALAGAQGWITGLRADQSPFRNKAGLVVADHEHHLLKFSPLIDWTRQAAHEFAADRKVPTNPLHRQGFLSIGCSPCTRAVRPGESERAGRWWWEDEAKKECGLHLEPPAAS
jgi:phosphoadenosine phosphosulfate reductase